MHCLTLDITVGRKNKEKVEKQRKVYNWRKVGKTKKSYKWRKVGARHGELALRAVSNWFLPVKGGVEK